MDSATFSFDQRETVDRLRDSLSTIESFLPLVPGQWTHAPPGEGSWSVAMNLAHMVVYEELLATPVLESIAAGADAAPSGDEGWLTKDAETIAGESIEQLADRLRAARNRQIVVVASMSADLFNAPKTPLWSTRAAGKPLPASWVAMKTFQHTWEHGNAILRVALFAPR